MAKQQHDPPGTRRGRGAGLTALAAAAAGTLILALILDPIPQPPGYHDFADRRRFLGIDNFSDVASNLPFLAFGLWGLAFTLMRPPPGALASWRTLFTALVLVSVGSAWYHLAPDNPRLALDRLPLAAALAALFVAMLAEHTDHGFQRLLVPGVAVGLASVFTWHFTDDLRFYLWVQAFTLSGMLVLFLLFRSVFSGRGWLAVAFALFLLAKAAEHYDALLFAATRGTISGHTIKHLLAGCVPLCVLIMLVRRGSGEGWERDRKD